MTVAQQQHCCSVATGAFNQLTAQQQAFLSAAPLTTQLLSINGNNGNLSAVL
jgi:hypothetical protein